MIGRIHFLSIVFAAAVKKITCKGYSRSSLLISTDKDLCQHAQTTMFLPLVDPFELHQWHIERLAAGFVCGQPGQLVVPYVQVTG